MSGSGGESESERNVDFTWKASSLEKRVSLCCQHGL
jgi:hypothetical protein